MCLGNVIRPTQSEDLFLSVRLSGVVLWAEQVEEEVNPEGLERKTKLV